jgi:rfaE bifunctional protein kinase chain/domain
MTTAQILAAFPRYSALIVGDICLDRRCVYDPAAAELSRETKIARLGVVSSDVSPGGGGTVGNNLAALGITRLAVLGAIGEDGFGWELTRSLNSRGISTDLLVRSEIPTFTYTKLINGSTGEEDQPRVDFINTRPLPDSVEKQVLTHLDNFAETFDVLFVSDQAETKQGGVVTPAVRERLLKIAEGNPDKVVWVDSRVRVERFQKMILKPNEQEADAASIALFGDVDYQRLRAHAGSRLMFVTKGDRGVLVVESNSETLVPARVVEHPVDICGAGDSFSAGAAMALAITGSAAEAARFGNLIASLTIMKRGTGTTSPEEVLAAAARE